MIYISDYGSLNKLIFHESNSDLKIILNSMVGKRITVFVKSGGASGCGFTGILSEVLNDSIRLCPAPAPLRRKRKKLKNNAFKSKHGVTSHYLITIDKITAVSYNFI